MAHEVIVTFCGAREMFLSSSSSSLFFLSYIFCLIEKYTGEHNDHPFLIISTYSAIFIVLNFSFNSP